MTRGTLLTVAQSAMVNMPCRRAYIVTLYQPTMLRMYVLSHGECETDKPLCVHWLKVLIQCHFFPPNQHRI